MCAAGARKRAREAVKRNKQTNLFDSFIVTILLFARFFFFVLSHRMETI